MAAIIEAVAAETRAGPSTATTRSRDTGANPAARPPLEGRRELVANEDGPGVVTGFHGDEIVARAADADAVVLLRAGVGDFVPAGAPLLELIGATRADLDVAGCVTLGAERTMQQDTAFGLRQLVDLAAKALSPGSTTRPPRSRPSIRSTTSSGAWRRAR